jgi:hypothetical protein
VSGTHSRVYGMKPKERYEKPELLVIELKAEEVLAIGCKQGPTRGFGNNPNCGIQAGCSRRGS